MCEKWKEVRLNLTMNGVYNPDAPALGSTEGRPHGNKKTKVARNAAPAAGKLHSSMERCLADAKSHDVLREDKSAERWNMLLQKHDVKLDLLDRKSVV